ncbi:hypothetical protein, partial [Plasmodium yoelii yoelii]
ISPLFYLSFLATMRA